MNLEKLVQNQPLNSQRRSISVFTLLFYLRIYLLAMKLGRSTDARMVDQINDLAEKEMFLKYLTPNVSKVIGVSKGSDISIRTVRQLGGGIVNATYLFEISIKQPNGSFEIKKIVGRHITFSGTYERTASLLKLYGKRILQTRPIAYPRERIKAELNCAQKMKEARVKMPEIIYVDLQRGYIFTKFIEGETLHDIAHQICERKFIENWQIKLFEEIGRGLAEINLKLKIAHGDTFSGNWIHEKGTGNLFLTDWETAGKGDPAWDLAHLIYTVGADLGMLRETTNLFNTIFLAITDGYAKIDVNKKVIRRFTDYWMNHVLKVPPKIHEIIFNHQGVTPPRVSYILGRLHAPCFNRHSPIKQEFSFADRIFFQFLKTHFAIHNIVLLISGRTNPTCPVETL